MTFSSSPVLYPTSSSPPPPPIPVPAPAPTAQNQKRKLFQTLWAPEEQEVNDKKKRMLGGFIFDDDDDDDDDEDDGREKGNGSCLATNGEGSSHNGGVELYAREVEHKGTGLVEAGSRIHNTTAADRPESILSDGEIQTGHGLLPFQNISGDNIIKIRRRSRPKNMSLEETIAQRSTSVAGRAKTAYYGVDIHKLLAEHKQIQAQTDAACTQSNRLEEKPVESVEPKPTTDSVGNRSKTRKHQMWTEKYRARKFTDLIGDEETHRAVLRWLKSWDPVVFPGSAKPSVVKKRAQQQQQSQRTFSSKPRIYEDQFQHRKILVLTGPPGLGKTTLAHVCARQVGYEVMEINASDERSREVVKGRIRDALETENVKGVEVVNGDKKTRKAGRPVCVIVDEVDGATSGSSSGDGGGEGGFMRAVIDLIQLDQRNSQFIQSNAPNNTKKSKKKGDNFKLLRPLMLVCNDLYAPAIRPLRSSSCAEIIRVRTPPVERAISRLREIFHKEGIASDGDAARRLCQASWGSENMRQGRHGFRAGAGEGDFRGVLVQAEWMAHKLRSIAGHSKNPRLTKAWVEENTFGAHGKQAQGSRRGGVREIVDRIFSEGAGLANLPTTISAEDARLLVDCKPTTTMSWGVSELRKRAAIATIRESADMLGDHDRLISDCFSSYLSHDYQDDSFLTKPNVAYDWLCFHDMLSSRVFGGQEWELNPYLSEGACAFHYLFSAVDKLNVGWGTDQQIREEGLEMHPFAGPRADFVAFEAERANRAFLSEFLSDFSAPLARLYQTTGAIATELVPNVTRMLAPEVKPVVIGGSAGHGSIASVRKETEKNCIRIASRIMGGLKITFDKVRVEVEGGGAHSHGGFALRMEPPLDSLATFESLKSKGSSGSGASVPVRYAVRQVLDQEQRKESLRLLSESRLARGIGHKRPNGRGSNDDDPDQDKENGDLGRKKQTITDVTGTKRDFFGRIVNEVRPGTAGKGPQSVASKAMAEAQERVWISFHEGFSNAVRKPITLKDFMDTF